MLDEIRKKTLDIRLDGARAAQERKRFAFLTATIISVAIIIAGWNAYFSSYRDFAWHHGRLVPDRDGKQTLQKALLAEWIQGRFISISPLGIRVGVDEAPLLGALAMFVITIWLYFSARREHTLIGSLLDDYRDEPDLDVRRLVYHGVSAFAIFTASKPAEVSHGAPIDRVFDGLELRFARPALRLFFFLPAFALVFMLVLDVSSAMATTTPLRDDDFPLGAAWFSLSNIWEGVNQNDLAVEVFKWIVCAVMIGMIYLICNRIWKLSDANETRVKRYWSEINAAHFSGQIVTTTEGATEGTIEILPSPDEPPPA